MSTHHHVHHRVGGWLPKDHRKLESWLDGRLEKVEQREKQPGFKWHPVIQEFQKVIEEDPELYLQFHIMFEQIPKKPPYDKDPFGKPQVRDYIKMLSLFDCIISEAPGFEDHVIHLPFTAVLDWPMGTQAGLSAFAHPKVNTQFKKMFDVWYSFLTLEDSCYVLTSEDHGWLGPRARENYPDFEETFVCDPNAKYYGFTSWDNFFTRPFRPGVRPILLAEDDRIINNACESTVFAIKKDVQAHDRFWLKEEPYSLLHMLDHDELAPQFVGGTVSQAFLSSFDYHRWHSPVNGTVVKTVVIPGAYFAESPALGLPNPDPTAPNVSQGFYTQVAARALVFIDCDNPDIGLMCFMSVGMGEVSTNEITIKEGQKVKKGDELGMFHFGGSTHCLLFRSGVKINFDPSYQLDAKIKINAPIATVG